MHSRASRDNVYLNLVISPSNDSTTISADQTLCKYDETLSIPVIQNPSEYYCSIIRFSLPIDSIPIMKFPLNVLQNNPLISNLVVGIKYLGGYFAQNVVYVPANNYNPPTPGLVSPFFTSEQSANSYYDIFSIQALLDMVNTALALANAFAVTLATPPHYVYDSNTELISLIVPAAWKATGAVLTVNRYLKNYLASFSYFFNADSGLLGYVYDTILSPVVLNVGGFFTYVEEYVSIALWLDIRKIIIQTTSIPIMPESVPNQNTTSTLQQPGYSGVNSHQTIITDFALSFDLFNQISSVLVYNPSTQYRLVDMTGNTPLNKIDLQFFYVDKFGFKFPIYINPTQQASVKIAFLKKTLYN